MADQKTVGGEQLKNPENKDISAKEQAIEFKKEGELNPEKKEISAEEKIIADELRREIELMEVDPDLKEEAEKKAKVIEFLGSAEKIEHLLQIARDRGLVFAIKTAKGMNDPHSLDTLHDILTKEGYYKKFNP